MSDEAVNETAEQLAEEVDVVSWLQNLKRIAVLLVCLLLVTSACMNVYVIFEYTSIRRQAAQLVQRMQGASQLQQFTMRLVQDMLQLRDEHVEIRKLLDKHRQPLQQLGVRLPGDQPTGSTPAPFGSPVP